MNRYYLYIVMIFSALQLQAMEDVSSRLAITGEIYIDGPVAYGPEKYYKYLAKTTNLCTQEDVYVPLIQVAVVLDDQDENGTALKSHWTNNDSREVWMNRLSVNKDASCVPHIIQKCEIEACQQKSGTDKLSHKNWYEIREKFFPTYIPVTAFKDTDNAEKTYRLIASVLGYSVRLACISNPNEPGKSFQANVVDQLRSFIKNPRYFTWRNETAFAKTSVYIPIKKLMEKKYIKTVALPRWMHPCFCHTHQSQLCPTYCCSDTNNYEHGIEGIKNVEKLEYAFGAFIFGGMLLGDLESALAMIKLRDERRDAAREDEK